MKKLLAITFIIFSNLSFSADLYLYYEIDKAIELQETLISLDEQIKIKEVYSPNEKRLLESTQIHPHILKVRTNLSKKKITEALPGLKVEEVEQIELNSNDYTNKQWHLNNQGGKVERWVSDIDQVSIQAQIGEDIQSSEVVETQKNIKVAVIDSGVDIKHPDLVNKITKNPKECEALGLYKECLDTTSDRKFCHEKFAKIDADNNGYPLDCQGWSFTNKSYPGVEVTGNPEMSDQNGHGTHVAGIIAAEKNGFGTTGVIENVTIIPIQVGMYSGGDNPIENIAKGVLYAINAGADVINLSLGWRTQFDSKMMREMVSLAIQKNILVVVAGGNNSHADISYPCAYDDVICTGAHGQNGKLSTYSNNGTQIDIIAPGNNILSTWTSAKRSKKFTEDDQYEYLSGTSQAAPIVSGSLAKLLNQGLNPTEARVKLLKGARDKNEPSDIRHGNLDIKRALEAQYTSFLYPLNKAPYLIKWTNSTEHKFKLKIKNYGKAISGAKIKVEPINENQSIMTEELLIDEIAHNEVLEKDIHFIDLSDIESELRFRVTIESKDESKSYIIKAHYIRLIDSNSIDENLSHFNLKNDIESNSIIRPFNNITATENIDFFVSHKKGTKQYMTIMKYTEDGYIGSRPLPIRDNNPVFLNFSKVDLDGDQEDDYVIMYVYIDKKKNKITKFMIFDHNLMPKRYLIAPKNEFANDKTFIPGKFKWLKLKEKMVPAWIGFGDAATIRNRSPWSFPTNTRGNHFYYLTDKGLANFQFDKDEILLHTLYQSPAQVQAGEIEFITTKEVGFEKNYLHYKFQQENILVGLISLNRFFDMMDIMALQGSNKTANAFFHEESINGGQNILRLRSLDNIIYDDFIKLDNPVANESIKYVHLVTDDFILYQTNFKMVLFDRSFQTSQVRESKVDTKRRRYRTLLGTNTLYLPSSEAPGMTSELMRLDQHGTLVSDGRYRTLAINNCEEFGTVHNHLKDYIGYLCKKDKKILLLEVK